MKWLWVALGASVLLNVYQVVHKFSSTGVQVVGVIDGDTIVLSGKSRVRLRYVDAPEKGMCGYEEASKELKELVLGKTVRIEETIPDTYGRGMALVYTGSMLVNREMVAGGWVRYHHDTSSQTDSIKAVADTAKQQKLGVYGTCQSTENSLHPSCVIKGNIDRTRKTYYLPGCAQYAFTVVEKDIGESWFCTEKEARAAGFTKAKTCP